MGGSRTYRTKAIVLDKTKLKETDLILTLVGESGRQIRAVAKGARKPGSRLAARCELCCEVDLLLAHGRTLDVVSQADLIAAPLGTQPGYELLAAASAVAEVAERCTYEDAEDPFVYPITSAVLTHLAAVTEGDGDLPTVSGAIAGDGTVGCSSSLAHLDLLVAAYVFKLLSHVGYRPDYSACVACGDEAPAFFSAQAGGLLCASCASGVPGCEPVDANMTRWLESLVSMRFAELTATTIDPHTAARLLSLAHQWAATHLECRLRALEFLLGC